MIWIFYLVYLYICGTEGSLFLSFPNTSWITSSKVCRLQSSDDINKEKNASQLLEVNKVEKAWISTRVYYSRWAAFGGCLDDVTNASKRFHVSMDECAVECSKEPNNTIFAYKNNDCFCFGGVKNINHVASNCRQPCGNTSDIACQTGHSALLFKFIEVPDARISTSYIEKECISTTPKNGTRFVENCDTPNKFHCEGSGFQVKSENWYTYQTKCVKDNILSLNITDSGFTPNTRYWTPIFRCNILQLDQFGAGDCNKALTLNNNERIEVANCTDKLPFLCKESIIQKAPDTGPKCKFPNCTTLPFSAVIATGTAFIILILIIFVIACKIRKMKTMIAERDSRLSGGRSDNFPPPSRSQSNKVRLRDTYIDAADSPLRRGGYNDVYDDVNNGFKIKS